MYMLPNTLAVATRWQNDLLTHRTGEYEHNELPRRIYFHKQKSVIGAIRYTTIVSDAKLPTNTNNYYLCRILKIPNIY